MDYNKSTSWTLYDLKTVLFAYLLFLSSLLKNWPANTQSNKRLLQARFLSNVSLLFFHSLFFYKSPMELWDFSFHILAALLLPNVYDQTWNLVANGFFLSHPISSNICVWFFFYFHITLTIRLEFGNPEKYISLQLRRYIIAHLYYMIWKLPAENKTADYK